MVTVDSATADVPALTTVIPGLIWLSVGLESLFLYCARSVAAGAAGVVTTTEGELAEATPIVSRATTKNEYVVLGVSPVRVSVVVVPLAVWPTRVLGVPAA